LDEERFVTAHQAPELRRQQILETAERLFVKSGYVKTSLRDIAKNAQLSKGAVTHYYPSKHALFLDCIRYHFEQIELSMSPNIPRASGLEGLMQLAGSYLDFLEKNPLHVKFGMVMTEAALRDDQCQQLMNERYHYPILNAISDILRGHNIASLFQHSDQDPTNNPVVYVLKAAIDGLTAAVALGHPINSQELKAMFESIVSIFGSFIEEKET
jgi:AcrR family transcriptional regulator